MASVEKSIRVGVLGVGRGQSFANAAPHVGMELVAICDKWEKGLADARARYNVATYADYDRFLEHDMDAVVLANYFHEHAPFAVKALDAGCHVMSECAACHTLGEGVALTRAVERSGKIYMFAENYPYMAHNQEMRRRYLAGDIGDFRYGEAEYIHPMSAHTYHTLSPGRDHWRNWIPATYYCTHALAPIMFVTDTMPVKVNGFVVPYDFNDPTMTTSLKRGDPLGVLVCRMDNGAIARTMQFNLRGEGIHTRIHGNRGLMETCRCGEGRRMIFRQEGFDRPDGKNFEEVYVPDFAEHAEEARKAGHGGGDFYTTYYFAEAIRSGKQPYLDVYRGVAMSIAGVQAYRSALADSAPMEIPDFRDETVRKRYENDDWSPDPARRKPGQPFSSILGDVPKTLEAYAMGREIWRGMGYEGE